MSTGGGTRGDASRNRKKELALALAVTLWLAGGGVASAANEVYLDSNGGLITGAEIPTGATAVKTAEKTLSVTGDTWPSNWSLFGGKSDTENLDGYALNLSGVKNPSYAYGGYSSSGAVTGNTVTLESSIVRYLYGGYAIGNGTATGNTVTLKDSTVRENDSTGDIYGGRSISGDATGNTVTLENSTVKGYVYGGHSRDVNATGNTVTLKNNSTVENNVYGGYAKQTGNVTDNIVTLENSTAGNNVYGGYTSEGIATGNTVNISGGTVGKSGYTKNIAGGFSYNGSAANNNTVTITGGTIYNAILGGWSYNGDGATADGNTVSITDSVVNVGNGGIFGGYGATATNNTVTITGGEINAGNKGIIGGYADVGAANNNTVTLTGATVTGDVYGGYADPGEGAGAANNNTVTLTTGATVTNSVYGGYAHRGTGNTADISASSNTVNMQNGTVVTVYGGYANGSASGNTVNVSGGEMKNVYGGYAVDSVGTASGNRVTISGGKITTLIYGGYFYPQNGTTGTASDNVVTIDGGDLSGTYIYGGAAKNAASTASNNTVNINTPLNVTKISVGYSDTSNNNTLNLGAIGIQANTVEYTQTIAIGYTDHTIDFQKDKTVLSANVDTAHLQTLDITGLNVGDDAAGSMTLISGGNTSNFSGINVKYKKDNATHTDTLVTNGITIKEDTADKTSEENNVTFTYRNAHKVLLENSNKDVQYKVVNNVNEVTLGEMTWGTGRALTAGDYDFTSVANANIDTTNFKFTNPEAATGSMTLLSNATNLAAGDNIVHTQSFTKDANGATLSATLNGNVTRTTAGQIGYTATGTTLNSVDLAGWNGTASAVPTGWTANAAGVDVTAAGFTAPTIAAGTTANILTTNTENFFSDEKITGAMKYTADAASSDTASGITLTGAESKGVTIAENGKNLVYARSNFNVSKISLGEMTWGTGRDANTGFDYAGATVDASGLTFTNPEAISTGNTTLLQANATLADIAATEKNLSYTYAPVAGVTMDGQILGIYAGTGGNLSYTATENKADKLTFGNVEWKDSGALLDHSTTLTNVSFSGADVDTSNINFTNIESLEANKKMTLVSSFGDTVGTITGTKYKVGSTLEGEGKASLVGNDLIFTAETGINNENLTPQEQTHNTVMGATVSLATLSAGNDFIGSATEGLAQVANIGDDGLSSYANIGGGTVRQETGSHVDTHTWNAILALGRKNKKEKSTFEYGAFFEYGSGNYTTHNGDERGDGSNRYTGGGLLAKWTANHGFYVEGSLRAGTVHDDARNVLRDALGNPYSYETNANYFGGHVGVGKEITLANGNVVDVYGKYFYNRRNGVSFDAGGRYDLDPVTSQIVRVGARYTIKGKKWDFYAGAAYEHELDGKATGAADGFAIRGADTSGGSFRGELGATVTPDKNGPLTLDFNLTGFAGKKQGLSGGVSVALMF